MPDYQIRLVTTPADRAAVYRLRYELYVEAQGLFSDMADHERRWLFDELDEEAAIWVAEADGTTVGTLRLVFGDAFDRETRETFAVAAFIDTVPEREMAAASRVLVMPEHRGGRLTILLVSLGMAMAIERGVEVILADCEPHLVNLWLRLGFRPYGLYEHPTNGVLVRIAVVIGDLEHVKKIRSPLVSVMSRYAKGDQPASRLRELLTQRRQVVSEADAHSRYWATVEQTIPRTALAQRLGELTDEELGSLLDNGLVLECEPGAMLIRKGHVSRTLYVLLAGSLVVLDEGETITEVRSPGELLGEVAFFTDGERMSDVAAGREGANVLALSERNLRTMVNVHGTAAAKLLLTMTRGLCQKLRQRANQPSEAPTLAGIES